jgi:hypothetical protein
MKASERLVEMYVLANNFAKEKTKHLPVDDEKEFIWWRDLYVEIGREVLAGVDEP